MENIYQASTEKANIIFIDPAVLFRAKCLAIERILPAGHWQELGPLSEITEEQAAGIMDDFEQESGLPGWFFNAITRDCCDSSALRSLKGAARSLGIPEDKMTIVLFEPKICRPGLVI